MMIFTTCLIISIPQPTVTNKFLDALIMVESNGNDKAKGDKNRKGVYLARGCLQIHDIYRREANRIMKAYIFDDSHRWDREASREMARIVLTHWAGYHKTKGVKITPEVLCSLHRHPCSKWVPDNMLSQVEMVRTRKLKALMRERQ